MSGQRISVIISEELVMSEGTAKRLCIRNPYGRNRPWFTVARGEIVNSIASSGIIGMTFPQEIPSHIYCFMTELGLTQSLPSINPGDAKYNRI